MMEMRNKCKILLVDDDPRVLETLYKIFREEYEIITAGSGGDVINIISRDKDIAVVVMDIKMPGIDGIQTAREIKKIYAELPIIFHTGYPGDYDEDEIDEKEKPFDYVQKGEPISRLARSVRNAAEAYRLKKNSWFAGKLAHDNFNMIGQSPAMKKVYENIRKIASTDTNVLITGETGTGKDLTAKAIHNNSRRRNKSFLTINCHHRSQELTASELFGHLRGSFTHAFNDQIGKFELADRGTIFFDEISDLDPDTQAKLLKVMQDGEFSPIGSPDVRKTDVRVIFATHQNLSNLIKQGKLRDDLYFRIGGTKIELPPLRDRKEDIPLLVEEFSYHYTLKEALFPKIFDQSAISALLAYDWPGNIRELEKAIETLIIMCDSDIIMDIDVRNHLKQDQDEDFQIDNDSMGLTARIRVFRRNCIVDALSRTNHNIAAAARILKVDRANLRKMMNDLGISSK
jgi:DNA-binding NtrC family response regulator